MRNKTRVNHRYPLLWLVAGAILIAACGDVTGFHARMFETGAPEFTLVLHVERFDHPYDSVSFSNSVERLETTGFSGRAVRIYFTLANPEGIRISELYLTFPTTHPATIIPDHSSPFRYTVNPDDADEDGVITIVASSIHTNLEPLNPPTNVTFYRSGVIAFDAGANNAGAGAYFTYTLYRNQGPVYGFRDRPIGSDLIAPGLVDEMLRKAGVYTVRVTARTVNPAYMASSSASALSASIHVHEVTVTINGDGDDMVTVNRGSVDDVEDTETFTARAFHGSTVTLTAIPADSRLVTWSGEGETDEEAAPAVRVITNIIADVDVTATFADRVITFTHHPATPINVVFGNISGSLSVAATVSGGGTLSYQWFSNTSASNVGGSALPEMTGASFTIPTDLAVGVHYFFAEASADGAEPVRSTVAEVTVSAPVITITQHPAAMTTVTAGSITGSLSVVASVTGEATLSYQWFSNTSASNAGGSELPGMTGASFTLPTDLAVGRHYFFAQATAAGATPMRSAVAAVVVRPPPVDVVWVQGGSFNRGQEPGFSGGDTGPVYTITISAFYLGRHQVTREQWTTVMAGNPNGIPDTNINWSSAPANFHEFLFNVNRRPVTHVSWYDAIVFSNRMSIQRGLIPAYELPNQWPGATSWSNDPDTWGAVPTIPSERWDNVRIVPGSTGYRLPTEAQWEFAAKGGNDQRPYTFAGNNAATEVGWIHDNSGSSPRMVGRLPANSLGLHDMTGNAWEWVWDWFGGYTALPPTDPVGASSGSDRVVRGGGWGSGANVARSVFRGIGNPIDRGSGFGFRVARP